MENYVVVLLLSVFVLLGAFYVNTVEQRITQHGNEIKQVKEELESTKKERTQVKVELESTRKELKQVHVELESTRNALQQVKVELELTRNALKQVKVDLDSTREQVNILRKEMIEKDNARKEEIDQIRANVKEIEKDLKAANIPVAFYAYLSANLALISVPTHSIIKYDVVDLNLGNGYSASSGQFTAPSDGLYVFHITTGALDRSHAVVELISNGVIKDITWADSWEHGDRSVATTVTPLNLRKGDTVNARIGLVKGGAVLESTNLIRCSFSGFKVH